MRSIAIISEGPTDQVVLRNIFVGYFSDKYFDFNYLQPKPDATKTSGYTEGNWDQVFKYIQTDRFRDAFDDNEFVVIQIDTDFQAGDSVGLDYRIALKDETHQPLPPETIAENMRLLLVKLINQGEARFFEEMADRILFAISVHSIECWLLPIYPGNPSQAQRTDQCMNALNKELVKKLGFTINKKELQYYNAASEPYRKRKNLLKLFPLNPSFNIFMNQVQALVPTED